MWTIDIPLSKNKRQWGELVLPIFDLSPSPDEAEMNNFCIRSTHFLPPCKAESNRDVSRGWGGVGSRQIINFQFPADFMSDTISNRFSKDIKDNNARTWSLVVGKSTRFVMMNHMGHTCVNIGMMQTGYITTRKVHSCRADGTRHLFAIDWCILYILNHYKLVWYSSNSSDTPNDALTYDIIPYYYWLSLWSMKKQDYFLFLFTFRLPIMSSGLRSSSSSFVDVMNSLSSQKQNEAK